MLSKKTLQMQNGELFVVNNYYRIIYILIYTEIYLRAVIIVIHSN